MTGLSPNLTIVGLVTVYFLSHYLFASLTAHATAMLPILLSLGLSMPGIPFEKLALMLGLTQGIMGVLTPYATGARTGLCEQRLYYVGGILAPGYSLWSYLSRSAALPECAGCSVARMIASIGPAD
jgi:hypothetical protein